jgi:hypothetical protein
MNSMRRLSAALVMAAMVATGLGTATLEAKKKGGGDPKDAICTYLEAIITYPYVSEWVLLYATSLYNYYGCAAE